MSNKKKPIRFFHVWASWVFLALSFVAGVLILFTSNERIASLLGNICTGGVSGFVLTLISNSRARAYQRVNEGSSFFSRQKKNIDLWDICTKQVYDLISKDTPMDEIRKIYNEYNEACYALEDDFYAMCRKNTLIQTVIGTSQLEELHQLFLKFHSLRSIYIDILTLSDDYKSNIRKFCDEIIPVSNRILYIYMFTSIRLVFPFDVDDSEGICFEQRQESMIQIVRNQGQVPAGLRIIFTAGGAVARPEVMHMGTRAKTLLDKTMSAGESIVIDSRYGKKGVYYQNGGDVTAAPLYLMAGEFITLGLGDNAIRYAAESGVDALSIELVFTPYYLGV